ncbi:MULTISPECIES: Ig-like domain-containing protein [unclassified Terrabacter]|uniref:L,D-transpeptidase n=1 Tax=unclassified Terrabacter TaxID=2630222 RepID=UPI000ACCD7F3|nr:MULTISPECIES: Ig-like domain-containing protein [unclassified Terrabacter]
MKLSIRSAAVSGMAVLAMLGVTACNATATADNGKPASSSSSAPGETSSPAPTPTTDPVVFKTTPADESEDVSVDTRVTASAEKGTLKKASLSYKSKKGNRIPVDGTLDGGRWTAGDLLEPGVKYTLALEAEDADGKTTESTQTFRTSNLTLDDQVYVAISPRDGGTVGIGMPVVVRFDLPVVDKASFEKHMKVTSTPAQAGSWYWLSSREAHWRPKTYWKAGTKVHVEADLNGVPAGGNRYGQMSRTSDFTIGRAVVAKVNLKTDQMDVFINGKWVKRIPVTGGRDGFTTRSGVKVIMDKQTNITMRAETIGLKKGDTGYYEDTPVKYAMRVTNSGEFLHTAPWSVADQGHRNVSHGCTGMSDANGKWLYGQMQIGDVVETTGTNRPMTMGNGYSDWNLSWARWTSGSAL